MNKFHLIQPNPTDQVRDFVSQNQRKVVHFEDIPTYTDKIKSAMAR